MAWGLYYYQCVDYKNEDLLDLIHVRLGNIDELVEAALYEETCPGACAQCGAVHLVVDIDDTEEYCDECGEDAVKSVVVLAGVV